MKLKQYYQLVKPGIIYGNMLTATAGFLFASRWHIKVVPFLSMLVGTSLVIAAACTYNNVMDKDIDSKMKRTQKRALVRGDISVKSALVYASLLVVVGFAILSFGVNARVVGIGIVGFIDYIVFYGWSKRHSPWSTIIGSISGATPILAGYVAFTNKIDVNGLLLFASMIVWQMPHFYAIAMYRHDEYAAAHLPVLTVSRGSHAARIRILAYIAVYSLVTATLSIYGRAGYTYAIIMELLILVWLYRGVRKYALDDIAWGKSMFLFSLIVMLGFSASVALGSILA